MLITPDSLAWFFESGRDNEGDAFSKWLLVHESGRIVAWVENTQHTFAFNVIFFLHKDMDDHLDKFYGVEFAKEFAIQAVVGRDLSTLVPKLPKAITVRAKVTTHARP